MEILWLASSRFDSAELPSVFHNARFMELAGAAIPSSHSGVAIVEVNHSIDAARAFDLLAGLTGSETPASVWIYYPDATVSATVSFLKSGAVNVAATIEELEDCLTLFPQPGAPGAIARIAGAKPFVGVSRLTQAVAQNIELIADRRCNVLIEGETGTGKEVVARAIHASGSRSRGPWVAVNCGAIPEALLEAELFGHVRGAFTGAVQTRVGKFEAANRGTIFLDEIAEMPLAVQAKLLRVLQERELERLGGNERIPLDVRVIAATNANLAERVAEGTFRQDLYFRLNVFRLGIAPLRDRPADIPVLAQHFAARICAAENIRPKSIDPSALSLLVDHDWPGNARELENAIETAIILSASRPSIYASDIRLGRSTFAPAMSSFGSGPGGSPSEWKIAIPLEGLNYQETLNSFERDLLNQAIVRTRGNKTAAADLLRLKRTTLSARIRVLESRAPRLAA